jgi:hypothetical protein
MLRMALKNKPGRINEFKQDNDTKYGEEIDWISDENDAEE